MQLELPDSPSVAVLPFSVMSDGEDDQVVADAMAEDLTRSLARVSNLFVIARSSNLKYVGEAATPATVVEELGVRHIVRASFRRTAGPVRLDADPIDAISGRIVWSDRFESEAADLFSLQDELVERLARKLLADLGRAQDQKRFTSNPEAFFTWSRGEEEAWGKYGRVP
jgi:TolB-like protein